LRETKNFCGKQKPLPQTNPTRHCEAQRAVAPNAKHALKQSETCTALMLRLLHLCASAALRETNFHRHCEAQHAAAPNAKHALKQSETCTALMLRLLQPRR
jgi:hypothetical protein